MQIYAIELTSCCNLRCSYCPQSSLKRNRECMPLKVFEKALDYPFEMNIVVGHLFGEALLHPDLIRMVQLCQARGLAFGFSTNTLLLEMDYLKKLMDAGLSWLMLSFHCDSAKEWLEKIQTEFPSFPVFTSALENKHDWAGQVNTRNVHSSYLNSGDCIFHTYDLAAISAQGEVLACCLDAEAQSSRGSLFNFSPKTFAILKNDAWFELCSRCHMRGEVGRVANDYTVIQTLAQKILDFRASSSLTY